MGLRAPRPAAARRCRALGIHMSARHGSGSSIAPIFLRLCLGITFVWAGLGKVMNESAVSGDSAAVLANMGVIAPAGKPTSMAEPEAIPTLMALAQEQPKEPAPKEPAAKEPPASAPASAPAPASANQPHYTAADFPEPVKIKNVHFITMMVAKATVVPTDEKGEPAKMRLLPAALGQRPWPVVLAWGAAITELVGGAMILVGLFTRFWALGLAVVMGVAMWLTQFGPAIQAGTTQLLFLPQYPAKDLQAWMPLFWQFSLTCSALAVLCLGAGALSLDGLFFMKSGAPAPKPAAEKPAQG
jgi:uncharacterized membrane protein YphA (DoxX/SURF4 family)